MDDADAALLRERDREMRFRDRVHGGADNRNVQTDAPGETGSSVGVGRQHAAARRL